MKPHSSRLALGLVLMGGVACQGRDATVRREAGGEAALRSGAARDEAMVRVVHAIAAEGPVDVFAGDAKTFSGIAFRGVTKYARVTPNMPTFHFTRAAQASDTLAEERAATRDAHYYTLVAMGSADGGKVDIQVVRDDAGTGDPKKARIRVINAAPGSGEVDVFLGQDESPLFDNVGVQDDVGYREVDTGSVAVIVRPDDKRNVLLSVPGVTLKAGTRLTLVLTRVSPRSRRLSAIRLTDDDRGKPAVARDSGR
jgi:hypothetical protein